MIADVTSKNGNLRDTLTGPAYALRFSQAQ